MPSSVVQFSRYDLLQERAAAFLREWSREGEILVIGSSRYAADDLVRRVCDTALIGIHRYTFRDLVFDLAGEPMNARGLAPMRRIAREALAASLARSAKLDYLRPVAGFPGFPHALTRTLETLRLNRVRPAEVERTGRTGRDIARLLELYEAECRDRGLADYAQRVELAIEGLPSKPPMALLALDLDLRTEAERELLALLTQRAPASLHASLGRAENAIAKNCLESVQQNVLSGVALPTRPDDGTVALLAASSEALEFIEVARRTLRSGLPFDRIAVLLRNQQRHAPLLMEAFERAGIPLYLADGVRRTDLSGRAFLTLLRCREERYSAARFAEYLALREYPFEEEHPRHSSRWERLLREAAVVHDLERWKPRLAALLEEKLTSYGEKQTPSLAADINSLEALTGFAVPLIEKLACLPATALWRDWIAALRSLGTAALRRTSFLDSMLDELVPVADTGPVSLPDVVRLLEQHVMTWQDGEGTRYGKVFAGSIEEARGLEFALVFVPGLNEGLFPRAMREDPLLLDTQRAQLRIADRLDDGQLLRIAVACAAENAVCSWSRVELATGRERVPSFFAMEVAKAAWGSTAEVRSERNKQEATIGWSAPTDPRDSIDDIEYDLASFAKARKERISGGFAWLRAVNAHSFRAIRARHDRWGTEWTRSDGLIGDDVHLSSLLSRWRLNDRAWSATALADFARCPYRFYLKRIADLAPLEEPEALGRMDPAVRGKLFHATVAECLRTDADPAGILNRLAAEEALMNPPLIRGVWTTEVEKLLADIRGWLASRDQSWSPLHVELEFDEVVASGFKIRGAVDLVEEHTDGRLRVIDHKTGVPPKKTEEPRAIGRGEVLQPLLYALAVEAVTNRPVSMSFLSYATTRGGYKTFAIAPDRGGREAIARVLSAIDLWIDRGFLPAHPREEACKHCDYLPVCGPYEEMRIGGKQRVPHNELHEIRRIR